MNILFDNEQLLRLITSLHTLTGIHANIFDINGKDIRLCADHQPFCRLINDTSEGHARCEACDAEAVKRCSGAQKAHQYRCHAGICETILPVESDGVPIAYMVFGQLLDDSPMEAQWENTARTLDWYPGSMAQLRESFFAFKQYSAKELAAYADLLEALASFINLRGIIRAAEYSDLQKLEIYLAQHYMEKLSLAVISADLHIGRTKLCALAKQLSGGKTLSQMIAQRRVNAAKALLLRTDTSIAAVAEQVGISDYNYFTKIFRAATGMTPSTFRKEARYTEKNAADRL